MPLLERCLVPRRATHSARRSADAARCRRGRTSGRPRGARARRCARGGPRRHPRPPPRRRRRRRRDAPRPRRYARIRAIGSRRAHDCSSSVVAVLRRVVTRGVRAHPVGHRLDRARARRRRAPRRARRARRRSWRARRCRRLGCSGCRSPRRAGTSGDARLRRDRHRDRPLVVLQEEDLGRLVARGEDHRLVHVALAGGAVAVVDDDGFVALGVAGAASCRRRRGPSRSRWRAASASRARACRAGCCRSSGRTGPSRRA